MNTNDMVYQDYDIDVERAISVFYGTIESSEQDFVDSCQFLVDSGVWMMDKNIGETCLFLMETGNLFMPEYDQLSPDGEYMILGTPRKNVVH